MARFAHKPRRQKTYSQAHRRRLWSELHAILGYGLAPALLVLSLVANVHFKRELGFLLASPEMLSQVRATCWLLASLAFFFRVIATPRGDSLARFALLLLSTLCAVGGMEALRWGGLIPGMTMGVDEPAYGIINTRLLEHLDSLWGVPTLALLAGVLGFYGGVLPLLVSNRPAALAKRQFLLQAVPIPRFSPWFIVAGILATGYFTLLGAELGQFLLAAYILLVALTPREIRIKFPWPDSAVAVLFTVGSLCFLAVIAEPYEQRKEDQRLENLHTALLAGVTSSDVNVLLELFAQDGAEAALKTVPLVARASSIEDEDLVIVLLERGADPNIFDTTGKSALEFAAERRNINIALSLISKGATIDLSTPSGTTPLIAALRNHDLTMVNLLLKQGAEPNGTDSRGRLPLIEAARGDFAAGVQRLMSAGVDIEQENIQGETALMVAPELGETRLLLMSILLDTNESSETPSPPMLAVFGSPSLVWDAKSEPRRLVVASIRIKNFGRSVAREVEIYFSNEEMEPTALSGPSEIAPLGEATYVYSASSAIAGPSTERSAAEKDSIKGPTDQSGESTGVPTPELDMQITSRCEGCAQSIAAALSEF